jgi:hypothetical protein
MPRPARFVNRTKRPLAGSRRVTIRSDAFASSESRAPTGRPAGFTGTANGSSSASAGEIARSNRTRVERNSPPASPPNVGSNTMRAGCGTVGG